jgi:hypothetical protein
MLALLLVPAGLQVAAMLADEVWFHRRRGLPRWERVGHPLDTLTAVACYAWLVGSDPGRPHALAIYIGLAAFSCLFITKDEFVHARLCSGGESWLHSVLFVLHPIVFFASGVVWRSVYGPWILVTQLGLSLAFAIYQVAYWSFSWNRTHLASRS